MSPEEAKALYRLAWYSYIALWGRGTQHRWRLSVLGRWMDELQVKSGLKGDQWKAFMQTVPGALDYFASPISWRRHRGLKPRHPDE